MNTTEVKRGISLEIQCECRPQPSMGSDDLYWQMIEGNYDLMSVFPVPLTLDEWREDNRTGRKRAQRAANRGYAVGPLAREEWEQDIYRINTSSEIRQGRPMGEAYRRRQTFSPLPDFACPRHAVRTQGVWTGSGTLVGYITLIRSGELALISQILGHDSHLKDDIMFLLFQSVLAREIEADPRCFMVYNKHCSGTQGLRDFKSWLGFEPMEVEWLP